ncbi:Tms1p KNAG_0H03090 [Huiozyma naganishii CBS 8797]|uniref:Membrane protein TMS1 n=1 Tax=Huiozyma naganishii (strain ATCC MYA-139 / BCRC 22969 / CBS 8797 / KCTC 17520 / NBRC 10181 / NCYC 3082 / Yp74L-3) TaxID=1071383 RepID=J7S8T0_HUIN7|nr:hypothetical protein KNAG_0H03090 [Kazachstania naganishii CBS 8797]CCK71724.1 hypothetical protein KNAG_0H03090 [Kazachstania naganishii CBS 8797]
MGAIVSLPITMGSTFVASCVGGCCSNMISKTFNTLGSSSLGTRLLYAFWLLINSLISWISMSTNKSILWPGKTCTSMGECGFFTVHRFNFALGILHALLGFSLLGVKSTKEVRAALQNSWWSAKFIVYLVLVIVSFTIPNEFFVFFSKWVSMPSGVVFILIGLILIVDFAHEWAETCIYHVEVEDENSDLWKRFLVIGTAGMYTLSAIMTVTMYILFSRGDCHMNQVAVTVNLVLTILTLIVSIHPTVQEANPRSGLAQSSMVSMYCTYLTLSAMTSEPDDKMCNPLIRSSGTRKASVVIGSLFTFIAIAYTTTRAAANTALQGSNPNGEIYLGNNSAVDESLDYAGLSGQSRNQLRYEAIKQAVDEGSLPESALYDNVWLNRPSTSRVTGGEGEDDEDDEVTGTKYNYSLFHFIFFLATQWIAILLTINVGKDDVGDFIPVGRTYFYSWVKILSAWLCYALYNWTVIAPLVSDKFDYDGYY